jgi:hypothetical protein
VAVHSSGADLLYEPWEVRAGGRGHGALGPLLGLLLGLLGGLVGLVRWTEWRAPAGCPQ